MNDPPMVVPRSFLPRRWARSWRTTITTAATTAGHRPTRRQPPSARTAGPRWTAASPAAAARRARACTTCITATSWSMR